MPADAPAPTPRSLAASDHGSAWVTRSPREAPMATDPAPAPSSPRADVLVIGAGIAGMTAAYLLAEAGRSVVILEAGPAPAVGETSRSTAQMATALDDRLYEIERMHGAEGARRTVQSQAAAIDLVERVCAAEGIDCDFERLDGYLFAAPDTDPAELDRELAAYGRSGFPDVEKTDRVPLPPGAPRVGPALRFPRQAQFDPVRYVDGLAAAVRRRGGTIRFNSRAESVKAVDGEAVIGLEGGGEVRAGWAIVATNTPFNDRVVVHTKQGAYRSYVVALRLPAGLAPRALVWDNLDAYHYARLMPDDAGDTTTELLLVGGEDHKTGQDGGLPPEERYLRLEAWARQHYPGVTDVVHRWSGQVLEPEDGLPFIGRNPLDADNILIATGDSGMGTTNGTAAGILLADLVQGRENPWETLYDPARKMLSSAGAVGEFLHENLNVGRQYLDLVTPGDVSSPAELAPGASAIIRQGLTKVAVHRDAAGALHCRSAVCPHLGGIVRWNEEAKSWDCPCHGSRFDVDGAVLNGPAVHGLEAKSLE